MISYFVEAEPSSVGSAASARNIYPGFARELLETRSVIVQTGKQRVWGLDTEVQCAQVLLVVESVSYSKQTP